MHGSELQEYRALNALASCHSMLGPTMPCLCPSRELPVQTSNEGIVIGSLDVHAIRALPGEVLIGESHGSFVRTFLRTQVLSIEL